MEKDHLLRHFLRNSNGKNDKSSQFLIGMLFGNHPHKQQ